jgi:3-hydroxyacyl-[acyl-carrier-protein] dehydratase
LAQLGAVTILSTPEDAGKLVLFGGIERARFRAPVTPGDTLRLEVEIAVRRGPIGKGKSRALLGDGRLAAEAELTFAIVDRPD